MSEVLVLCAIVVAASSGLPGLLVGRTSMIGQWVTTLLAVLASVLGLMGIGCFWVTGDSTGIRWPWPIAGGEFSVAVDGLSAFFLLPIFLIALLGAIYGLAYWKQSDHSRNGRKVRLFFGTMTAGMALVAIARDGFLFLFAWEIMALSAFFLISTEDHEKECCEAGWLYLVATHAASLCLFALFALLRTANGSFALIAIPPEHLTPGVTTAMFVLALVGFGLKAGIMPLHIWLPSAHASSPSHVSAIMSGVLIKMGIYGLVRVVITWRPSSATPWFRPHRWISTPFSLIPDKGSCACLFGDPRRFAIHKRPAFRQGAEKGSTIRFGEQAGVQDDD